MLTSKNYIVFFIPYVTVVCSLFHLVYFGMFGLNGLNLITVGDIIKSAAYPLLLTFLFSSIGVFIGHKVYGSKRQKKKSTNQSASNNFFVETLIKLIFFVFMSVILVTVAYFIFGQLNYIVTGFAIGNIFFGMLNQDKLISDDIAIYVDKEYLLMLLVYFPCFAVATAVQDADKILTNKSYKYTNKQNISTVTSEATADTLKFIGMAEQIFLFTDLKNENIYFIKSDTVILKSK